jgi:hypothetical protein
VAGSVQAHPRGGCFETEQFSGLAHGKSVNGNQLDQCAIAGAQLGKCGVQAPCLTFGVDALFHSRERIRVEQSAT